MIVATDAQLNYLAILLNDCGFGTQAKRNDFISLRLSREIDGMSDISKEEASKLITELKARKEDNKKQLRFW